MTHLPAPRLAIALAQAAVLRVVPGGGQGRARRNACAGCSGDAVRARERREAERAVLAARAVAGATAAGTEAVGR